MSGWDVEKTVRLLKLRLAGIGFTQIAKEMGITKNAAIGRYQRTLAGMKRVPNVDRIRTEVEKIEAALEIDRKLRTKRATKRVMRVPRPKVIPREDLVLKVKEKEPVEVIRAPVPVIPVSDKQRLVKAMTKIADKVQQLTTTECSYPIGYPSRPDFTYCFAPIEERGQRYCDAHCEVCYNAAPTRKRTNYVPGSKGYRG